MRTAIFLNLHQPDGQFGIPDLMLNLHNPVPGAQNAVWYNTRDGS